MTEDLVRQCYQLHHRKSLGDLSSNSTIALAIEERARQDKANHCRTVGVLEHAPEDLQRLRCADCRSIVCSFRPFEFLKGRIAQDDTGITQRLAQLARGENIGLLQVPTVGIREVSQCKAQFADFPSKGVLLKAEKALHKVTMPLLACPIWAQQIPETLERCNEKHRMTSTRLHHNSFVLSKLLNRQVLDHVACDAPGSADR